MGGAVGPKPVRAASLRRASVTLGLLILVASAMLGGDLFGLRERVFGTATPEPRSAASGFVAVKGTGRGPKTVLRSQPWWQHVRELSGGGPSTAPLSIDRGAIQWRAVWTCMHGRLVVRDPRQAVPVVDATCPGTGAGSAVRTGPTMLRVRADGPWKLRVDQQVDVPLDQAPLPAMTAPGTARAATGTFRRIDQSGIGRATMYRMAGGGYVLRLTGFYVTPNVDLELRLSPLEAPRTTHEFRSAPSVRVADLPITAGSLNFRVPHDVNPARYRSLVIWCPPAHSAYAFAPLK
jgi:hypothetical protein